MANKDQTVNLDIRNSRYPAYPATAQLVTGTPNPNNYSYSFAYSGGTDGQGNVEVDHGQGAISINVSCIAASCYEMAGLELSDAASDLNVTPQGRGSNNGRNYTIHDTARDVQTDHYKILVTDNDNGGCQFYCDPRVTNR